MTYFHASCSHRGGNVALTVYHSSSTQDKGRRNWLPFCQDRRARTDYQPSYTPPFSLPARAVLTTFFPSRKFSVLFAPCSAGTCFRWELGDVAILWGNMYIPIFNIINWKKPPSNEQFVRSEHPHPMRIESSSQLTLTGFDHVTVDMIKTQKEGTDGHIHTIIPMLMLCVPLLQ